MNDGVDPASNETRTSGPGPGERLQSARIQQGLSLEDVASRMHLSPNILEAIEDNHFEEITAPIFVKGYLRAYARIVSLDEDEMIEQYAQYYSGEDPPISSVSNVTPELSAADARMKWTTFLVVLVLAALLAAWWWNREQSGEAPISLDARAPTGEESVPQGTVSNGEIEAVSESELERGDADTAADESSVPVAETLAETAESEPESEPEPEPTPEPVAEEAPALAQDAGTVDDRAQADAAEVAVVDAAADTSSPTTGPVQNQIAPSGNDRLEIVVNADTWADIKDGSNFQLVYDLLRADRRLELMGQAPFSVFLGNGHGVELRFNDSEVDLGGRIRDDNTIRIQIGG
ncbi:MAG: DUF4115 domain-containing protein [Gammaproteobacteria bacterium]|nr:DUF4115 domain-containing protein [Gammaproteobacteria bacterium]